jgi:hypothetical protein
MTVPVCNPSPCSRRRLAAQPGAPTVRWPLFSPRVFTDKSPAINEHSFAPPFVDQGPSMVDQPLALIGDEPEGAPASQEGFKGPPPLHFIENDTNLCKLSFLTGDAQHVLP